MFGLGFGEIVLLVILGVILIGPKELPQLIKSISKVARQWTGAREEWVKAIREDPSIREITESIDEIKDSVERPVMSLEQALREEIAKREFEEQNAERKDKDSKESS